MARMSRARCRSSACWLGPADATAAKAPRSISRPRNALSRGSSLRCATVPLLAPNSAQSRAMSDIAYEELPTHVKQASSTELHIVSGLPESTSVTLDL